MTREKDTFNPFTPTLTLGRRLKQQLVLLESPTINFDINVCKALCKKKLHKKPPFFHEKAFNSKSKL